jgi:hypothetical protein
VARSSLSQQGLTDPTMNLAQGCCGAGPWQHSRSRQMGQLLAWYRSVSAQEVHRHRWRQGRISVSRRSDRHTTHSLLLSLFSSSEGCGDKGL